MKPKLVFTTVVLIVAALILAAAAYLHGTHVALLQPSGSIGESQRNLIVLVTALSMIIIVPVFALTIFVGWKYREGNTNAKHNPNWDFKPIVDVIWWTVPTILILIISVIIWQSTHALDPYKPISSPNKPINIQVVALDWKWLFIYPDQGIATVNYFEFPQNTPVNFLLTADAPMNSFWIPDLGGQIYAMPAMSTGLHLIASTTGSFPGVSANLSGAGFADMNFIAQSVTQNQFNQWVAGAQQSPDILSPDAYNKLAQQGSSTAMTYSLDDTDLYNEVIMKEMMGSPAVSTSSDDMNMDGMQMQGMNMNAQ